MARNVRRYAGSRHSMEPVNASAFHLTPDESPLLSNGPTGSRDVPLPSTYPDQCQIQPIDVSPALLIPAEDKWFFTEHARSLLQNTKLISPSSAPVVRLSRSELITNNHIEPSVSNETCLTATLTSDSGCSFSTIDSPLNTSYRRKMDVNSSETDDDKCQRDQSTAQRPLTPELELPNEPDDFLGPHDVPSHQRTAAPSRKPRPQRSTSYLGTSHSGNKSEELAGGLVPKKYRFIDGKQAYIHEDASVQVIHNMPCAVNSSYEPSTIAMDVSKYYLTVHQKPAVHTRKLFHGLRSHLHKSSSSDWNETADIIQVKTSGGDRRLHRDIMTPWVSPSDKYPNSEIYEKYRISREPSLFQFDHVSKDGSSERDAAPETADQFELQTCIDLRRHSARDVDLFLCFLYGHVKKEDVSKASVGVMELIALDCGLFKLHQVLEQITLDHVLSGDPLAAMTYAASTGMVWLHVAAFDYLTSNFYYYKNGDHFHDWTVEQLEIYVKSDQLRLKTEFDVFVEILDWLAFDNKANLHHANRLLDCVRFFRMTTEEIYECLSLNAHSDVFEFSQMQMLLTAHLLIQDYIKKGEDSQLAIPENRSVEQLAHWDPRQLYRDLPDAQIFLNANEPFVQEMIVKSILKEERQAKERQAAAEQAKQTRASHETRVREEEDRCKKLFEMMGICMDGRSRETVDVLKTKELQALIPFLEPVHARWPWPGPPVDGGKLDHQKDAYLHGDRTQLKSC